MQRTIKLIMSVMIICASNTLVASQSSEYQQWLGDQQQSYQTYKKTLDEEFSDMLNQQWKEFKSDSTPSPLKKTKPKSLPKVKTQKKLIVKDIINSPKVKLLKPNVKQIQKPMKKIIKKDMISFDFYSNKIMIEYQNKLQGKVYLNSTDISKKTITAFWNDITKTNYKPLLKQIKTVSDNLNLNDWAKYQLINKLGFKLYKDKNIANLFSWFVLLKFNYDAKIAYNDNNIYLLSTVAHNLYQISFVTIKQKKYFILQPTGVSKNIGSIITYPSNNLNSQQRMSFEYKKPIKIDTNIITRNLKFKYFNKNYNLKAKYSKDLVDFYSSFPQSDYFIYFDASGSNELSNSLAIELSKIINGKSEAEAVNMILRFVQTAFDYKTDPDQFNKEKVMFPEETIYYRFSDCEDRAIMFSYLVKKLLKLNVVGLKYKDHLATAVEFSSLVSGDSFKFNSKRYTVCDPTYINANFGTTMPKYKHSKFTIVNIK